MSIEDDSDLALWTRAKQRRVRRVRHATLRPTLPRGRKAKGKGGFGSPLEGAGLPEDSGDEEIMELGDRDLEMEGGRAHNINAPAAKGARAKGGGGKAAAKGATERRSPTAQVPPELSRSMLKVYEARIVPSQSSCNP